MCIRDRVHSDQIVTHWQLYDWAKGNIQKINFLYSRKEDYARENKFLEHKLKNSETIKWTQQFHS